MFYNIFIFPMVLLLEVIIRAMYPILIVNPILATFLISLLVNSLSHPVFMQIENLCQEDRENYQKLLPKIMSIQRNFKGNERRMLLRTFFKQSHYHPFLARIKQSLIVFLQVPLFVASYLVISENSLFKSAFMDDVNNFLSYDNITIRILPILMILANVLSLSFYLKKESKANQLFSCILPVLFFILLYKAPASIVLYWTFNNCFSLLRNISLSKRGKFKYSLGLLLVATIASSVIFEIIFLFVFSTLSLQTIGDLFVYFYPLLLATLGYVCYKHKVLCQPSLKEYIFCIGSMLLLFGIYLPTTLVASDPDSFYTVIDLFDLLISEFEMGIGVFFVYPIMLFLLIPRFRRLIYPITLTLLLMGLYHFWNFNVESDIISSSMRLEISTSNYGILEELIDLLVECGIIILVSFIIWKSWKKYLNIFLMSLFIVYFIVSLGNIRAIITAQKNIRFEQKDLHIELSKNGKNILILFMDRAISGFLPLILEENPKLVKELSGFVYYPRTISFATQTLYSEPSLLGGYEYTPKGLQNDKTRQMVDKHNEAISVLPELFRKNNYQVSLVDIPYPNYNDPKRPSVYHPDIFISKNKNYTPMRNEKLIQGIKYNVFSFNLMRLSPRISRNFIYNDADYFNDSIWRFYQNISSQDALAAFNVYIDQLKVIDQKQGTLMILHSKLPHEPTLLNKNYEHFTTTEEINSDCPDIHRNHSISNLSDRMHYDVNMLSYIEITKLFHKMKGMGVYNNTRIIVVSDHGWHVEGIPDVPPDITQNNAVLLVKDFNTIGKLKFDSSFMTTADVPFLACQDIIQNPINPFTHKTLTTSEKDIGIDIIDSYFSKWSPTQYKDKKRTYLYEDEGDDEVTYRHIDKNTIKDIIKMEKEKK